MRSRVSLKDRDIQEETFSSVTRLIKSLHYTVLTLLICMYLPTSSVAADQSASTVFDLPSRWESVLDKQPNLRLSSFKGKPTALALVYSSCPAVCPFIVETLRLATADQDSKSVNVVLITLDPEHDTAAELSAFAKKHGVSDRGWFLLRGQPEDIREISVALQSKFAPTADGQFIHSNEIFVFDTHGGIKDRVSGTIDNAQRLGHLLSDSR